MCVACIISLETNFGRHRTRTERGHERHIGDIATARRQNAVDRGSNDVLAHPALVGMKIAYVAYCPIRIFWRSKLGRRVARRSA
jgi:hypothetical protein